MSTLKHIRRIVAKREVIGGNIRLALGGIDHQRINGMVLVDLSFDIGRKASPP